ncbi:MAG TPA: hypothetical protein VGZ02_09475, partial [Candidatus Baltobacteraceae bacterium]|nr:hypothetical protein [Candidatus Baltobacteraceae bacterium]
PTRSVVIPLLKNNLLLSVIGLAIDASDNIFLSTSRYAVGPGLMQKYAPGSTTGVNTGLTPDIEGGFDSAGNMYVGFSNSVCVYAPGGTHCARRITKGLSSVTPFAVAPDGTLFVPDGSHYSNGEPQNGDVTEFAPGGSSPVAKFSSSSFVDPEGAALGFLP